MKEVISNNIQVPIAAAHSRMSSGENSHDETRPHQQIAIQAKLTVGAADDPLEREADEMADKVMRMKMPEPINFLKSDNSINRKCAHCEEEEKEVSRKESGNESSFSAPSIVNDALSSGGKSMDAETRSFMESRFSYDFGNVKIHDDGLAAKSASSINALAYTSGNDVVFNSGQYNTNSDSGKRLLAHELTHVVQQSDLPVRRQEETPITEEPLLGTQPARFIVEDDEEPGEGQVRKSEFLDRLNTEICATVDETMQGTPFSSANCPYIRAAFARHYNSSPIQIQQLLERYAPLTAFAQSIDEVIASVKSRVAIAAFQWLQNGGNLSELTDEASSLVPDGGEENPGGIFLKENSGGGQASDSPASVISNLGKGSPLDGSTRGKMESAFGTSFSDVEVHTDSHASSLSSSMNARAFTVGNHIAFSNGEHQPGSLIGDALMAHELAHVVQQKGAGGSGSYSENALEENADQTAIAVMTKMMSGKDIDLFRKENKGLKTGLRISRCPKPSCQLKISGPQEVDKYCAAYVPSDAASCGVFPAPNIALNATGSAAGASLAWNIFQGGTKASIVGPIDTGSVTIKGDDASSTREDVEVRVTDGKCISSHKLTVRKPTSMTATENPSSGASFIQDLITYTVNDQFGSAMGAGICIDETITICTSSHSVSPTFGDAPTDISGQAKDRLKVSSPSGPLPANFCIKLNQSITAGGCGPLLNNTILYKPSGISLVHGSSCSVGDPCP